MRNANNYKTEADLINALKDKRALKKEIRRRKDLFLEQIVADVDSIYDEIAEARVCNIEDNDSLDEQLENIIERLKAYIETLYLEPHKKAEHLPDEVDEAVNNLNTYIENIEVMKEVYLTIVSASNDLSNCELFTAD